MSVWKPHTTLRLKRMGIFHSHKNRPFFLVKVETSESLSQGYYIVTKAHNSNNFICFNVNRQDIMLDEISAGYSNQCDECGRFIKTDTFPSFYISKDVTSIIPQSTQNSQNIENSVVHICEHCQSLLKVETKTVLNNSNKDILSKVI